MLGMLGTLNRAAVAADADTLVLALERDQDNMDPHMHFQRVGIIMNINMYDSLLHKNTKLEYEPSLATAWQALNETTWEFKLRQGVKFHNGNTFSAEDVKFSFDRVLDPNTKSPQYGNIRGIKEVKIIDPHTVHQEGGAPGSELRYRPSGHRRQAHGGSGEGRANCYQSDGLWL